MDSVPPGTQAPGFSLGFPRFYALEGEVTVNDGGIVSLSNVTDIVSSVTCVKELTSIQIDFSIPVGTSQLPIIFPKGSILYIDASYYGPCGIGESTIPSGPVLAGSQEIQDAFLLIEDHIVFNDYTISVSGKSMSFFNLFSKGRLSFTEIPRPTEPPASENATRYLEEDLDREFLSDLQEERMLQLLSEFPTGSVNVQLGDSSSVQTIGGVQIAQATWDEAGLDMTASVEMEMSATLDLTVQLFAGTHPPGREVQPDGSGPDASGGIVSLLPDIWPFFPKLAKYEFPIYLLDLYVELPLFVEGGGDIGWSISTNTRLRYATGGKKYSFTAIGPWDNLSVGAAVIESTPGRFTSSFVVADPLDFATDMENNYNIFAGAIPTMVAYGHFFSAAEFLEVGQDFTTTRASPSFPPILEQPGGILLIGFCENCTLAQVSIAAQSSDLELQGSVGNWVLADVYGSSSTVTAADLAFSITNPNDDNPSFVIDRAIFCPEPIYGFDGIPCGDICCDASTGAECVVPGDCAVPAA
jgi:hypothetical protein